MKNKNYLIKKNIILSIIGLIIGMIMVISCNIDLFGGGGGGSPIIPPIGGGSGSSGPTPMYKVAYDNFGIYIANEDGTGINKISSKRTRYGIFWSPDGTKVAYVDESDPLWKIYVYDLNTNTEHLITDPGKEWRAFTGLGNFYANNKIIVTCNSSDDYFKVNGAIYEVDITNINNPVKTTLVDTSTDSNPDDGIAGYAGVSSDGTKIAYVYGDPMSDSNALNFYLKVIDRNTASDLPILATVNNNREERNPKWSPTGRYLLYYSDGSTPSNREIILYDYQNGQVVANIAQGLTGGGTYGYYDFSPDETKIVFPYPFSSGDKLYIYDIATGSRQEITNILPPLSYRGITNVEWSKDGNKIFLITIDGSSHALNAWIEVINVVGGSYVYGGRIGDPAVDSIQTMAISPVKF
jgi:Tol biopolymer transport system component